MYFVSVFPPSSVIACLLTGTGVVVVVVGRRFGRCFLCFLSLFWQVKKQAKSIPGIVVVVACCADYRCFWIFFTNIPPHDKKNKP